MGDAPGFEDEDAILFEFRGEEDTTIRPSRSPATPRPAEGDRRDSGPDAIDSFHVEFTDAGDLPPRNPPGPADPPP